VSITTIPSAPNPDFYRKQAKELLKSLSSGDTAALARILKYIPRSSDKPLLLADAQWVLAREHGFASWPKFLHHLEQAAAATNAAICAENEGAGGIVNFPPDRPDRPDPTYLSDPSDSQPAATANALDAAVDSAAADNAGERKPGGQQIGTDAVFAKTGRHWTDWFAIFDAAGCEKKSHKEIVAVASQHGAGSWWQQMVAVEYERARGLRDTNMNCDGDYNVSASRTVSTSVKALFAAWTDPELRGKWLLGVPLTIRKTVPNKRVLITWHDGSSATVNFYPKTETRCQCNVEHTKLASKEEVEEYRAFWSAALDRLRIQCEG